MLYRIQQSQIMGSYTEERIFLFFFLFVFNMADFGVKYCSFIVVAVASWLIKESCMACSK